MLRIVSAAVVAFALSGSVALAQNAVSTTTPSLQSGGVTNCGPGSMAATSSDSGNLGTGASSSKIGTGTSSNGATGSGATNTGVMGTTAPGMTSQGATGAAPNSCH